MIRIQPVRRVSFSLGAAAPAGSSDVLTNIQTLTRNFPKCFKSREVVPTIEASQRFARSISTADLSRFTANSNPTAVKKRIDKAWWDLEYWRKRLSEENPEKTYCPGFTNGIPSFDRWQLTQKIVEPYSIAYEVEGASAVIVSATNELLGTLTFGFYDKDSPFGFKVPIWVYWTGGILAAVVGVALYQRVRGPKSKTTWITDRDRPTKAELEAELRQRDLQREIEGLRADVKRTVAAPPPSPPAASEWFSERGIPLVIEDSDSPAMRHEFMRLSYMEHGDLMRRLDKITTPQKMLNFYRALKIDGRNSIARRASDELRAMGWDTKGRPVHVEAKRAARW